MNETTQALGSMANGKAMGSAELPAELLKLGLSYSSREVLLAFYGIIVAVFMTGDVPQSGKIQPSKFYTRRRIGPSVATTGATKGATKGASLWWRMLARFFSKSWPIDLATSARKLELVQRPGLVTKR